MFWAGFQTAFFAHHDAFTNAFSACSYTIERRAVANLPPCNRETVEHE
jgi:hypothetical protein